MRSKGAVATDVKGLCLALETRVDYLFIEELQIGGDLTLPAVEGR